MILCTCESDGPFVFPVATRRGPSVVFLREEHAAGFVFVYGELLPEPVCGGGV